MHMIKAGLLVGAVLIGAIMALLGAVLLVSALPSGEIHLSHGPLTAATNETITRASDPARYWQYITTLGLAPLAIGIALARWGWRSIQNPVR